MPPVGGASPACRPAASPWCTSPAAAVAPFRREQSEQALWMFGGGSDAQLVYHHFTAASTAAVIDTFDWIPWSNYTQAGDLQRRLAVLQLHLHHVEASHSSRCRYGWWGHFLFFCLLLLLHLLLLLLLLLCALREGSSVCLGGLEGLALCCASVFLRLPEFQIARKDGAASLPTGKQLGVLRGRRGSVRGRRLWGSSVMEWDIKAINSC